MSILKDISELVNSGVITKDTADRIQEYYKGKNDSSNNRMFVVFGVLGASLVGLGIILLLAHNWDDLSRTTKTIFAFLPLIVGQFLCGYALFKKNDSSSWRESSAAFLFFAVGACIALISQIYNIYGELSSFLLLWMLLCLPLLYLMNSSIVSLLYIIGITSYCCEEGYFTFPNTSEPYLYWVLLGLVFPHYYYLFKNRPHSNFLTFHHWLIPISIIISIGTLAYENGELMFIVYISLFGLLYLIGHTSFFEGKKLRNNAYKILGSLGSIILLLVLSFDFWWEELREGNYVFTDSIPSSELWVALVLSLAASVLLFYQQKGKTINDIKPIAPVFLLFIVCFFIGLSSPIAPILINIIVFAIGVLTIREGGNQNHLGILNYGLLIITALIFCRFFDANWSFVIRGLLFVFVGIGFFITNYWMLQKRKTYEK